MISLIILIKNSDRKICIVYFEDPINYEFWIKIELSIFDVINL